MEYQNIILEIADGLAKITLNRPKSYNALCQAINVELDDALRSIGKDRSVRVLILTGGSRFFAAGADIREMMRAAPLEAEVATDIARGINDGLEGLHVPTIASICGMALGGGLELALACDFRVVAEDAVLGLPEVGLGILPGAGGTQRLARAIGSARAKEVVMLGRRLSGKEAFELGLATRVVPKEAVEEETRNLALELMEKPAAALMLAKAAANLGDSHGPVVGKGFERMLFALAFCTDDQKEGMQAFAEKREPRYNHSW
jgi:enoyl-CoA hydratase/carnithine racemase